MEHGALHSHVGTQIQLRGQPQPQCRACAGPSLHPRVLQCGQQEPGRALLVPVGFPKPTKVSPGSVEARAQHPAGHQLVFGALMSPNQL